MPLGAKVDGDLRISSLFSAEQWAQLKADAKAKRVSVSMRCGMLGVAKTSPLGTHFFAHAPGGDGCTAPESREHLLAKAAIVDGITAAGWTPEPEAPGEGWVADVLATKDGQRAVFEVQWSRQKLDDYRHRQQRYESAGIKSIAWFVRHTALLPLSDASLRLLPLEVSEEGEATVLVGQATLLLADVVERMLTRRLRRREFVGGEHPAAVSVAGAAEQCYRCKGPLVIWDVSSLTVLGRCGLAATRIPGPEPVLELHRYEELPAVQELGAKLARSIGQPPARLRVEKSSTAGKSYMGFVCPHCGALYGEHFLYERFANRRPDAAIDAEVPAVPVYEPHWCIDDGEGLCPEPSAEWASALRSSDGHPNRHGRYVSVARIIDNLSGRRMLGDLA